MGSGVSFPRFVGIPHKTGSPHWIPVAVALPLPRAFSMLPLHNGSVHFQHLRTRLSDCLWGITGLQLRGSTETVRYPSREPTRDRRHAAPSWLASIPLRKSAAHMPGSDETVCLFL